MATIPMGDGRTIYVAGRYRAKTDSGQAENIMHAQRVAIRLWELGWIAFCPHLNTLNFNWYSNLPDEVWLNGGLKFLEMCDCIFLLKGWQDSQGAKRELEVATERKMDKFYE
jgi:hypothetical protein